MKIVLFTKTGKPTVKEVIDYLKRHFKTVDVYQGKINEPFPIRALCTPPDILISYLSPWIIPDKILSKVRLWNINFHPGPPEYPGIGCFNFAIYNKAKTYGVTAHIMNKKVDCGRIIGVRRFAMSKSDSVFTLSIKSYKNMFFLFVRIMNFILKNMTIPDCAEAWKRRPFVRKELEKLCKIDLNMAKGEVKRRIKATTYPAMPGPYIELFGYKFEYNPDR